MCHLYANDFYLTLYLNNSDILLLMFKTSSTFTAYHTYLCFEMVSRKPNYIYICMHILEWVALPMKCYHKESLILPTIIAVTASSINEQ